MCGFLHVDILIQKNYNKGQRYLKMHYLEAKMNKNSSIKKFIKDGLIIFVAACVASQNFVAFATKDESPTKEASTRADTAAAAFSASEISSHS